MKTKLAAAIEAEDYETAAALKVELDKLAAAGAGGAQGNGLDDGPLPAIEQPDRLFSLGDCVRTTSSDISGLVAGWDMECCETDEWREKHSITDDERRRVFYILLINNSTEGQVAYVPESRLEKCKSKGGGGEGSGWSWCRFIAECNFLFVYCLEFRSRPRCRPDQPPSQLRILPRGAE